MLSSQWKCLKCGRVGDFACLGNGFILCRGCGAVHCVPASGVIFTVGRSVPELLPFCRSQTFHVEVVR